MVYEFSSAEMIVGLIMSNVLALTALVYVVFLRKRLIKKKDAEGIGEPISQQDGIVMPESQATAIPSVTGSPEGPAPSADADAMSRVRELLGGDISGQAEGGSEQKEAAGGGDAGPSGPQLPEAEVVVEPPERMEVKQNSNRPEPGVHRGRPVGSRVSENRENSPSHTHDGGGGRGIAQKSKTSKCPECGKKMHIVSIYKHMETVHGKKYRKVTTDGERNAKQVAREGLRPEDSPGPDA